MPLIFKKLGLAYYPTPKVASSTIKRALHDATFDKPWSGTIVELHAKYQTTYYSAITSGWFRFCVVRDPVERFVSAYRNRVLDLDELGVTNGGLEPRPSLECLVENLEQYRAASYLVKHHTDPQVWFIGGDIGAYEMVVRFEELTALRWRTGIILDLGHWQKSTSPDIDVDANLREKLLNFYQADYEFYMRAGG